MLSVGLLAILMASLVAIDAKADGRDRRDIAVRGQIVEVGNAGFALRIGEDRIIRVAVTDRTRITLNGEPAHLSDLQPRDRAAVAGVLRMHDGRVVLVARRVVAHRRV
jgi:hypothetical protein